MTQSNCIRCQHPVVLEDGHLVYCTVCGAPQIFLGEELQDRIAAQGRLAEGQNGAAGNLSGVAQGEGHNWTLAVEYALMSAGIALGLCLLSWIVPPLGLVAWLWMVSAPILTVGFYNARARTGVLRSGFAARLGLLVGLLIATGCFLAASLGLVLTRFALHHGAEIDGTVAGIFDQAARNAAERFGDAVKPGLRILQIAEFRVGLMLWMAGVATAAYVVMSTAAAGFAGLLLGRRRGA